MTRLEEDLRRWLADSAPSGVGFLLTPERGKLLLELLAEPRLPKELSEAMFRAFLDGGGWVDCSTNREYLTHSWRALYAHLTAPKAPTFTILYGAAGQRYGTFGQRGMTREQALKDAAEALAKGERVTIEPEGT